jgi:hypothetical protein
MDTVLIYASCNEDIHSTPWSFGYFPLTLLALLLRLYKCTTDHRWCKGDQTLTPPFIQSYATIAKQQAHSIAIYCIQIFL